MSIKQTTCLFTLLFGTLLLHAQSNIGFTIATSKNDTHMETLWYQQQVSKRFSAGLQLRYSGIRYRFVNARSIEEGTTTFVGAVLGFNLKKTEKYRFDFNLTTSYRRLNNEENPELPSSTNGLEIDPNFIFGLQLTDNLIFHTGAMFRAARQFGDEPISDEQMPTSAIVFNGLSVKKNAHIFSLRAYSGPMTGATGDTEKFFWQFSLGYQYNFNRPTDSSIPFFNF